MAMSLTFVSEMEEKNRASFDRLIGALGDSLIRDGFVLTDVLRLEQRWTVEALEVVALWLSDGDNLDAKLDLAVACGDMARAYSLLANRLTELDLPPSALDVRYGGYSKLFAFFRSLQTPEERSAAGGITLAGASSRRLDLLSRFAVDKGDAVTTALFHDSLIPFQQRRMETARIALAACATNEESQARARRASFRTIEILTELYDPALLKKYLSRSLKRAPSA